MLCLELDNTGKGRCDDVYSLLELGAVPPRWVNGSVSVKANPELRHFLGGRLSTNVLLDREGKILHSRIAAQLVKSVLAKSLP